MDGGHHCGDLVADDMETDAPSEPPEGQAATNTEARDDVSTSPSPSLSPEESGDELVSQAEDQAAAEHPPPSLAAQEENVAALGMADEEQPEAAAARQEIEIEEVEEQAEEAQDQGDASMTASDNNNQEPTLHVQGEPVPLAPAEAEEAEALPTHNNNAASEQLSAARAQIESLQKDLAADASKHRLSSLEAEKRDLLSVVAQLTEHNSSLEADVMQHRQGKHAAQETVRVLEREVAGHSDAERMARLKCQQATSQADLLQQDRDWHKQELGRINVAYQQSRSASHTQLSSLQSRLEASQRVESSATASLTALKSQHATLERRLLDSLSSNAELSAKLAESESAFKADIEASKRLTETLHKRDEQAQRRLDAVEAEWNDARQHLQAREHELESVVSQERKRADEAHRKLEELSQLVDAQHPAAPTPAQQQQQQATTPLTPNQSHRTATASPSMMLFSPAASLASRAQRISGEAVNNTKSYSELYTSYHSSRAELSAAQAECHRLSDCLASVLHDLEHRAPLLADQRSEVQQLRDDQDRTAAELVQALDDRDAEARRAQGLKLDLEGQQTENALMDRQLHDLGRQLREVLRVLATYQDPHLADRDLHFDVELDEARSDEVDTQAVISAQLVTYASISDLQRQNALLLKLTRQMGAKMDEQDRQLRQRLGETENASVAEATQLVQQMRTQLGDLKSKLEAADKEKAMLRRLLGQPQASRPAAAVELDVDEDDEPPPSVQAAAAVLNGGGRSSRDEAEHVQAAFDDYRAEMSQDLRHVKAELSTTQRSLRSAESEAAKSRAQLDFAQERVKMANEGQELAKRELADVNRQMQQLQSNMSQQDTALHRANEQVFSLQDERNTISHELSTLKTEREIWKRMEERLSTENARFSGERTEMQDTIRSLQHAQRLNETSVNDSRRRLEDHLARIDRQLDETRSRLSQEVEANRQLQVKSDLDTRTSQRKVDQLTHELSSKKEAVSFAQSTQRHLEQRIIDLGAAIAAKDDKIAIYEGRLAGTSAAQDSLLPREQQLELELAHLRASLRGADLELQSGRNQVEQFKATAEASEGKVTEAQQTLESTKAKMEADIAAKENELSGVRQELEKVSAELQSSKDEIVKLQTEQGTAKTDVEKQIAELQQQLEASRSETQAARQAEATSSNSLESQVEASRSLNSSFLVEQAAHAENKRKLSAISEELTQVKHARLVLEQASQSYEVNLNAGREQWEAQRAALQRELDDANKRCEEVKSQNTLLHQHLTSVTEQADKLRQSGEAPEGDVTEESEGSKLMEIVQYLRGQQELLEGQLQLERQEKARISAQLQHAEQKLEETRTQLTQERMNVGVTASGAQTDELLAKSQELTILRDSNTTLRSESTKAVERVQSLSEKIVQLEAQLAPLREQVSVLETDVATRDGQIKLLEQDNARWKTRNEQVLVKYDRIDPVELQSLKDRVDSLQKERDALASEKETEKTNWEAEMTKLRSAADGAKSRFQSLQTTARAQRDRILTLEQEINTVQETSAAAAGTAETQLGAKDAEWQATRKSLEETHATQLAAANQEISSLKEKLAESEKSQASGTTASDDARAALGAQIASLKESLESEKKRTAELQEQVDQKPATTPAAVADADAVNAEVERRLAAVTPADGQSAVDMDQAITSERIRVTEETTKRLEEAHQKALADQASTHQKAIAEQEASRQKMHDDLNQQLTAAQSQASSAASTSQTKMQELEKALGEAKDKITSLQSMEGLQDEMTKLKEKLQAASDEVSQVRQRESGLQKELDQAREASKASEQQAVPSGPTDEEVEARVVERVNQALQEAEERHQSALNSAVEKAQSEATSKTSAFRTRNNALIMQGKQKDEKITALQAQLTAAQKAQASSTPAAPAASAAPSAPSTGLNIKGAGKPSDLPPMPGAAKKAATATVKKPQAKAQAQGAGQGAQSTETPQSPSAPSPAQSTAKRGRGAGAGRGRGVSLGSAISSAVGQAAGGTAPSTAGNAAGGVKRTREDGADSGGEGKRRALGRGGGSQ